MELVGRVHLAFEAGVRTHRGCALAELGGGEDVAWFVDEIASEVLSGGDTDITLTVDEDALLKLERESFMRLARRPETLARVEHMLTTGKPLRIGLHQTLAPLLQANFVAPASPVEEVMARIWSEVLGIARVSVHDNFFFLGGDSLLATRVVARLRSALEIALPVETMFHRPTIAELALVIEESLLRLIEQVPEAEAA